MRWGFVDAAVDVKRRRRGAMRLPIVQPADVDQFVEGDARSMLRLPMAMLADRGIAVIVAMLQA